MARPAGADAATVAAIRGRFTYGHGTYLQWSGPTSDHLEMMGRDGHLLVLVSHPYPEPRKDCPDLELFRRAGLRVAIEGKDRLWYGHGSFHVRVEHPALGGQVTSHTPAPAPKPAGHAAAPPVKGGLRTPFNPAPSPGRYPGESAYDARLRRAGPALLAMSRERADELAAAIRLVPCVGPTSPGPCVSCELRADHDWIMRLIAEVQVGDELDSDLSPLLL